MRGALELLDFEDASINDMKRMLLQVCCIMLCKEPCHLLGRLTWTVNVAAVQPHGVHKPMPAGQGPGQASLSCRFACSVCMLMAGINTQVMLAYAPNQVAGFSTV